MQVRRRFKQALALDDRLRLFSEHLKAKAAELRPGPEQDALLKRARLADTASLFQSMGEVPVARKHGLFLD